MPWTFWAYATLLPFPRSMAVYCRRSYVLVSLYMPHISLIFFINSAIKFTIEFQRTSLARPFFASPAKALCSRLQRAFRKINADITPLSLTSHLNLDANVVPKRNLSSRATDWAKADLPACSNLCDHPTICVDTGDCQCVLSSCLPRARFPFSTFANCPSSYIRLLPRPRPRPLTRNWERIHVAPISESDRLFRENWTDREGIMGALRAMHCYECG